MNAALREKLRSELKEKLSSFVRSDAQLHDGVFTDAYELFNTEMFSAWLVVSGHRNSDTFSVRVGWDCPNRKASSDRAFIPRYADEVSGRTYEVEDVPLSAEFDLGLLVRGTCSVFHFLKGLSSDAPVSVEKIYSSGDGPAYKMQRVAAAADLVKMQVEAFVLPYLQALHTHFQKAN